MEEKQYVIMFNDYPVGVCAPDMTQEQADARAAKIKDDYLKAHSGTVSKNMLYVRACEVRVYRS